MVRPVIDLPLLRGIKCGLPLLLPAYPAKSIVYTVAGYKEVTSNTPLSVVADKSIVPLWFDICLSSIIAPRHTAVLETELLGVRVRTATGSTPL